jgi:hypothetical protein
LFRSHNVQFLVNGTSNKLDRQFLRSLSDVLIDLKNCDLLQEIFFCKIKTTASWLCKIFFVLICNDNNYRNEAYEIFSSSGLQQEILHEN